MINKANKLDNVRNSVIHLFTTLANKINFSLGTAVNCTIYKNGKSVCYIYFLSKSIQAWDEDQSGNECELYDELMSTSLLEKHLKRVPKSNGIPIQKLSLTTDDEVLQFEHDLLNL
ncbi:hypothetical protein KM802_08405 [Clostridium tyrobutyricum]|nr:hypothetical protein [Clostridium tyrobutyricum]